MHNTGGDKGLKALKYAGNLFALAVNKCMSAIHGTLLLLIDQGRQKDKKSQLSFQRSKWIFLV